MTKRAPYAVAGGLDAFLERTSPEVLTAMRKLFEPRKPGHPWDEEAISSTLTEEERHALNVWLDHRIDAGLRRIFGGDMERTIYSPQDACTLSGVSKLRLGDWDRSGLVSPSATDGYTPEDVHKLCAIKELLAAGLTMAVITEAMTAPLWRRGVMELINRIIEVGGRWS